MPYFFAMIKTQNISHLVMLTYILILPSIGSNGIGNHVSFADISNLVNDVHNAKEKLNLHMNSNYIPPR